MKNYKLLPLITGLYVVSLLLANTLNVKIFTWWLFTLPTGIIIFPLAFLFGDILTEVYGYATSRKVIWTGFSALILTMVVTYIATRLTPAVFWPHEEAFDLIFGSVPRMVIASICAYFTGEFFNSYVVAKMKVWSHGKNMAVRFVSSTAVGEAADSIVFVIIAFTGVLPFASLIPLVVSAWIFKVLWEIIALPISLTVVKKIKQIENEDYYDVHTNFSPFVLR